MPPALRSVRVLVSAAAALLAQVLVGQQLPFESYNIDDGLAQSAVVAIAQSPDGSLWFGTQAGLSRFDGLEFTNLGVDDGLPGALVRSLEVDPSGRLWVGTEDGVARIDPVSLEVERIGALDGLAARAIDTSATPLFGTWEKGLLELTDGSLRPLGGSEALEAKQVRVVRRRASGELWVGTWGDGVARQRPDGSFVGVPTRDGTAGAKRIRTISEDRRGRLWIGADDGLWRVTDSYLVRVAGAKLLDDVPITAVLLDSRERLWLATRDRGACRLSPELEALECLGVDQGLADNSVYALHEDHEGSMWLGTYGGGVSRLSTEGFFNFREGAGLAHANVYSFAEDRDGNIWVGTNGGGAGRWDGTRWASFTTRDGLAHDKVVSLLALTSGELALGTLGGLCLLDPAIGQIRCLDESDGLPHEIVLALAESPPGALWVGTHAGLARLDLSSDPPAVEQVWGEGDGPPDVRVNVLTTLTSGKLAVGTAAGLAILDPTANAWELAAPTRNQFVTAAYEDPRGALWVTSTDGLLRLARTGSTHWGVAEGLPHRLCSFAIGDGSGGMWIGTNRGLVWFEGGRFDPDAPERSALSVYTARDGLPSSETNRNAAFRDSRGRLWFGTVQGIAVVQRPGNPLPRRPPRTIVTAFASRDRALSLDGSAQLPGGRPEALDIGYLGISLSAGSEVSYQIKLEGFDPDWKRTRSRSVQYTALPPGRYEFLVRAGIPGSELSEPARLRFEIVPAWWQRRSVHLAGALGALAVFGTWSAGLKRRNRALEERVRERTQELQALNAELEHIALHDRLTGLPNRHALSFVVTRELAERRRRLARGAAPAELTFALVDLDRFKPLNDSFGHAFGDAVLVAVAAALSGAVREVDMVARWGGEEFLLVLRDAAPAELPALTRRVLGAVRGVSMTRPDGSPLELTASLGWCEFPSFDLDASRWEEILHLADIALYDAKASGRNNARGWSWQPDAAAAAIDGALSSRERPATEVARLVVA